MNRYKLTVNDGKPMPGVYVGDPCYILNDKFYQEFWGDENDFEDGELSKDGRPVMIVQGTAYGDGCYDGNINDYSASEHRLHDFPVDAGVLAVVNLEFADPEKIKEVEDSGLGVIFRTPCDTIILNEDEGEFDFFISANDDFLYNIHIDTCGEYPEDEEEDEESWYDEEEEEEEEI